MGKPRIRTSLAGKYRAPAIAPDASIVEVTEPFKATVSPYVAFVALLFDRVVALMRCLAPFGPAFSPSLGEVTFGFGPDGRGRQTKGAKVAPKLAYLSGTDARKGCKDVVTRATAFLAIGSPIETLKSLAHAAVRAAWGDSKSAGAIAGHAAVDEISAETWAKQLSGLDWPEFAFTRARKTTKRAEPIKCSIPSCGGVWRISVVKSKSKDAATLPTHCPGCGELLTVPKPKHSKAADAAVEAAQA
jgi:hypothetical protein